MDYYDEPEPINHSKLVVGLIVVVVVSAAIGYLAYHQFMKWHKSQVQSAVLEQQQNMAEANADLEYQILQLQNKLAMLKPETLPEARIKEVFGTPAEKMPSETAPSCDALNSKITSFFKYLQKNSYVNKNQPSQNPSNVFLQVVRALSANPPMVVDETRDMVSLKHNLAHFFRILGNDRIVMIKNILTFEDDLLEHAMADFYAYHVAGDCCKNDDEPCVSLNTLYEYAGFFLDTFAGKSYLFRRSSVIRNLTDYYAVLILDRANEAGINRYGIDIRPQIKMALDNIASQNNLLFQDQYMETLTGLQEKYRS